MGRVLSLLVCAAGSLVGACSPYGGGAFECSADTQCGGAGKCTDGFCSFPDSLCDSGFRYGELSGPLSGQCVGDRTDDAGVDTVYIPDELFSSCYGTGLVTACFDFPPVGDVAIGADVNTDTSTQCDTDARNAAWCVIAGESVTVPGTVHVTGSKPLVIVATQTISIGGTLDASSKRVGGQVGAAANPAACAAIAPPGTSGGGAGGSFGADGGDGGDGPTANTGGTPGAATPSPTALRGGCRGQDGNGTTKGSGGNGGGAVYLIAETSITIDGILTASGAGATNGTTNSSGGGGGGSGGFIGLDAPAVSCNGILIANGGGGGEGSGSATAGNPGQDATTVTAAQGGSLGSTNGGDGGDGGAGGSTGGQDGSNGSTSGGGGGGGVGIVRLYRASALDGTGAVSPGPS